MAIDLKIYGGGSVFVLIPVSMKGSAWITQNISSEGYQPDYPNRIIIEHRYINDIVSGARADGLEVA